MADNSPYLHETELSGKPKPHWTDIMSEHERRESLTKNVHGRLLISGSTDQERIARLIIEHTLYVQPIHAEGFDNPVLQTEDEVFIGFEAIESHLADFPRDPESIKSYYELLGMSSRQLEG